jgi:hypothetical protein
MPVFVKPAKLLGNFDAASSTIQLPGAMPQAHACTAPLALERYVITDQGLLTHLTGPTAEEAVSGEASVTGQPLVSGSGAG